MSNYIFPKLTNHEQFENLVRDLYKAKYPNTEVDKYGRTGQKQHGVDITIQGDIEGKQQLWCIQCKNYDNLTTSDVDDILKACTFYKAIKPFEKFIIATYAPNDVNIVRHLLGIRASGKYPYAIEYAPRETICDYIEENPVVFNKYYGNLYSQDTLKDECIAILVKYRIEDFLRIDPLSEGMHENLPDQIEECCFELQKLIDSNLSRAGDSLYKLVYELRDWLDSYNTSLSFMLFPVMYSIPAEKNNGVPLKFDRFMYLPPKNGRDFQYHEKKKAVYEYRKHLMGLIHTIATYMRAV